MKRIQHQVQLGYPGGGEGGSDEAATLTVTADHLVLVPDHSPRLELTRTEIVEFKIEGWIPFIGQAIVVEHIAFNKIGNLVFNPTGITCRNLVREIERVGFRPEATPGIPWVPGEPFPFEDFEEENAQHHPEPYFKVAPERVSITLKSK